MADLSSQLLGPQRCRFMTALVDYTGPAVDQAGWEAAAASMGMREVFVPYAYQAAISPGAQLFALFLRVLRVPSWITSESTCQVTQLGNIPEFYILKFGKVRSTTVNFHVLRVSAGGAIQG